MRPRSLNAERAAHWRVHRKATAEERERWGWLWREALPRGLTLPSVHVLALPLYRTRPQDTGNCHPTVKAAIDALVDLGVIPDDTGRHVLSITHFAPLHPAPQDALQIRLLEGPEPEA